MELCYANNPKSLFRKYAKVATWIANTKLGRWYLGYKNISLPKEGISLLLPNGFHTKGKTRNGWTRKQMVITTRACYAPRLYPVLGAIDFLVRQGEEFKLFFRWLANGEYPAYATRFSTVLLTKSPDANPETTTMDEYVGREAVNENWATIRAGAGNAFSDTNAYAMSWAQSNGTTNNYGYMRRYIGLFDCSSFPTSSGAILVVGANTVRFWNSGVVYARYLSQRLVSSAPASNTGGANADYGTLGTTSQATADITMDTANTYYTFTLSSSWEGSFSAAIQKLGLRIVNDATGTAPTWASNADYGNACHAADAGGTAPLMTITYEVPTAPYLKGRQRTRIDLTGVSAG